MPVPEEHEDWTAEMARAVGARTAARPQVDPLKAWGAAAKGLSGALDRVDTQLLGLKVALLAAQDPDLSDIANDGLPEVLGDHPTRLRGLLRRAQDATALQRPAAMGALQEALSAFAQHLRKNKLVAACDGNPVGAPVWLHRNLDQPLLVLMRRTGELSQGGT